MEAPTTLRLRRRVGERQLAAARQNRLGGNARGWPTATTIDYKN